LPSPEARFHLGEAAVVVAVAVFCLVFQLRLPTELPTDADFAAVQSVLERDGAPGDVVLLYPWWTEHARLFVPQSIPVVGYLGSDGEALPKAPRIWVLAQPNLPGSDFGAFLKVFSPQRTAQGEAQSFGNLRLQRFENGRFLGPIASASDAVASLNVYFESPNGERRQCNWDGRVHHCPQGFVTTEWHETHYAPRHCLRFFAPGGQTRLVAELSGVPQAAGATMEAGFIWDRGWFTGNGRTPGNFTFEVVGGEKKSLSIPLRLEVLQKLTLGAIPAGSTIKMSVQSDNPDLREFCTDFTLWSKAP
jgi:hypothetical protein